MTDRRTTHALLVAVLAALLAQPLLSGGGLPRALARGEAGGDGLFAVAAPGNQNGSNVLFLIDPESRRMAVYLQRSDGRVDLKNVRNVTWDLRVPLQWAPDKALMSHPEVGSLRDDVEEAEDRSSRRKGG